MEPWCGNDIIFANLSFYFKYSTFINNMQLFGEKKVKKEIALVFH